MPNERDGRSQTLRDREIVSRPPQPSSQFSPALLLALAAAAGLAPQAEATTYTWSAGSSWGAATWNGSTTTYPGFSTANNTPSKSSDVAEFPVAGSGSTTTEGINFLTGGAGVGVSLTIGTLLYDPSTGTANSMILGDLNTSQNGTLTLTGTTVGANNNVIISNTAAGRGTLLIEPNNGGKAGAMSITLASGANTIVSGVGTSSKVGNLTQITTNIGDGSTASSITFLGGGTTLLNGGELELGGTNSFTGGITVGDTGGAANAALVQIDTAASLPTQGGVLVNSGSELLLFNPGASTLTANYGAIAQTLTLNGIGTKSNSGALRVDGTSTENATWLGATTLASDSIVSVTTGNTLLLSGSVTDNAHQLQKQGGGSLTLGGTGNSASMTGSTLIGNGTLNVNNGSALGSGPLTMGQTSTNNTALFLNNSAQTIGNLSSTFTATSGTQSQVITLNGTALDIVQTGVTTYGSGAVSTLTSSITGAGSISMDSKSTGKLTLSSPNSYSGSTTISAGTLQFATEASLYNNVSANWTASNIVVASGATAAFNVGGTANGEFTSADLDTLIALGSATTGFESGALLGLDTTNANGGNFAYNTNLSSPYAGDTNGLGLTKLGGNTLTLGGANTYSGATVISAGTLTYSGAGSSAGNGSLSVTGTPGGTSVLNINTTGTLSFVSTTVGGSSSSRAGAINLSAGTFNPVNNSTNNNYLFIASAGYGAVNVTGGQLSPSGSNGGTAGILVSNGGSGVLNQSGGAIALTHYLNVANGGGSGVATLTGGSLNAAGPFGGINLAYNSSGNTGVFNLGTLAGGSASVTTNGGLNFVGGSGASGENGAANLNRGTLQITGGSITAAPASAGTSMLNLNGATIQAGGSNLVLLSSTNGLNGNVYNGGITLDSNGNSATVAANLVATSGNGLYPVSGGAGTLTVASGGSGYIGTPLVAVTGGSGSGAMAVANLSGGVITGVTITNPGQGYLPGDTLSFAFSGGGPTSAAPTFAPQIAQGDLQANGVGGLTKVAQGTLILSGSNSYRGVTAINAGTLSLSASANNNNNIAGSRAIVVGAGAGLDVTALNNSTLALASGQVLGGVGTIAGTTAVGAGSTLSAGTSTALGTGTVSANGKLTTAAQSWTAAGKYSVKISDATGAGTPGVSWDDVAASGLTVNGSGAATSTSFTISPVGSLAGVASGTSWIIAQISSNATVNGSTALDGTTPASAPNLLTDASGAFVLDTSGFSVNGTSGPSSRSFGLELVQSGNGDDLVLSYSTAPEPTTLLLGGGGTIPLLIRRRRRQ